MFGPYETRNATLGSGTPAGSSRCKAQILCTFHWGSKRSCSGYTHIHIYTHIYTYARNRGWSIMLVVYLKCSERRQLELKIFF